MAKAQVSFGQIVGDYFNETVLPFLSIRDENIVVEQRNQYIADSTTQPELIGEIEEFYGVKIW